MSEILKENRLLEWSLHKALLDADVIELVKQGASKRQILLAIKGACYLKLLECESDLEDIQKDD